MTHNTLIVNDKNIYFPSFIDRFKIRVLLNSSKSLDGNYRAQMSTQAILKTNQSLFTGLSCLNPSTDLMENLQMRQRNKLPKNIISQDGRLYFNKWYRSVRYSGALDLIDSPANRKTAGHISSKINAEMKLGAFDPNSYPMFQARYTAQQTSLLPLFRDYAEQWLKDKELRVAKATLRTYRDLIRNHLTPYYGDFQIDQITKPVVEKWLQQVTRVISRTYANDCLRRLKSIIYDAEGDFDFVSHLNRVKPVKCDDPVDGARKQMFTLEEASRVYFCAGTRLRAMMLCSTLAGLRTGEVIALRRENVDFNWNLLHVTATMSEGERKAPKSKAGVRSIPMHPVLRQHLAEILVSHSEEFVFVSQRGKPFSKRQNFYKEFRRALDQAGVRTLRWYALRKLYASLRYACNDSVPATIAKDMGHKDVAMTLNTYAEPIPHQGCIFADLQFPVTPEYLEQQKVKIAV